MSSSARILQVLGLFVAGHEVVTPERAMRALNISRATAVRHAQHKAITQRLFAVLARIENRLEQARARTRRGAPQPQR